MVPLRASNIFDAGGEGERWETRKSRLVELDEVREGWMRDGEDGVTGGARVRQLIQGGCWITQLARLGG